MRASKLVILVSVLNLFLICFGCSSNTSDNKSDGDFDQRSSEESDNEIELDYQESSEDEFDKNEADIELDPDTEKAEKNEIDIIDQTENDLDKADNDPDTTDSEYAETLDKDNPEKTECDAISYKCIDRCEYNTAHHCVNRTNSSGCSYNSWSADFCSGGKCVFNKNLEKSYCVFPDGDIDSELDNDLTIEDDSPDQEEKNEEDQEVTSVKRIVIAGDSWSCGIVEPTTKILEARGYNVEISGMITTVGGSTIDQWVRNHNNKLFNLHMELDKEPKAEILLLIIGANDINYEISKNNYHKMSQYNQNIVMERIVGQIQNLVKFVQFQRPHLKVVIIGYDYFHYDAMKFFYEVPNIYLDIYNLIFIDMEHRKLNLAKNTPGLEYSHNFGTIQHIFGDKPTPPFQIPIFEYPPYSAPKPGFAPKYEPFPGGFFQLPSPYEHITDGIHPSSEGFLAIMKNSFDQGLENLVKGKAWTD